MRYSSYLTLALAALMQATIAAAAPSAATAVCPGPPAVLRALQPDICAGKACSATVACCTCFFCIEGDSPLSDAMSPGLLVNVMENQKVDETPSARGCIRPIYYLDFEGLIISPRRPDLWLGESPMVSDEESPQNTFCPNCSKSSDVEGAEEHVCVGD
ncbi:hypothetical protein B0H19DRAFT_1060307 [Mycena capillaripes]|nr:hypothetical protein B0H19DRAFT_1060307 [Mycena capillaripes]